MTGPGRVILLGVSGAILFVGLTVQAVAGQGWPLMGLAGLLAASVLLEGRYRSIPREGALDSRKWQRTGEREIDSETGKVVEVWFNPTSGERRYLPLQDS